MDALHDRHGRTEVAAVDQAVHHVHQLSSKAHILAVDTLLSQADAHLLLRRLEDEEVRELLPESLTQELEGVFVGVLEDAEGQQLVAVKGQGPVAPPEGSMSRSQVHGDWSMVDPHHEDHDLIGYDSDSASIESINRPEKPEPFIDIYEGLDRARPSQLGLIGQLLGTKDIKEGEAEVGLAFEALHIDDEDLWTEFEEQLLYHELQEECTEETLIPNIISYFDELHEAGYAPTTLRSRYSANKKWWLHTDRSLFSVQASLMESNLQKKDKTHTIKQVRVFTKEQLHRTYDLKDDALTIVWKAHTTIATAIVGRGKEVTAMTFGDFKKVKDKYGVYSYTGKQFSP
ncbi:hypothetical protein B484DRAFT_399195 [Ochromonadaceae sp. CCMP2298]|nr:hypothetical protein B484DRAFT_399195 [Ochromonadaceae sp. CCMP2298]